MSKKPTSADAQLILQLYDLRREPELRKARNWMLSEFWPQSADDYLKIGMADLFLQPSVSGEMFFLFAKVHPFLKELRGKLGDPQSFANIEKLIASSKPARERLKLTLQRVQLLREKRSTAKAV